MAYISKENAQKYYNKLLDNSNNKDSLENKVSSLKKLMENEILKEVTGITHYYPKYKNNVLIKKGQRDWLLKNQKRFNNGNTIGFIPKEIVKDIDRIFPWRNVAEHPEDNQNILYGNYIGIFTTVAQTIKEFSKIDFPQKIKDICDNKKKKSSATGSPTNSPNKDGTIEGESGGKKSDKKLPRGKLPEFGKKYIENKLKLSGYEFQPNEIKLNYPFLVKDLEGNDFEIFLITHNKISCPYLNKNYFDTSKDNLYFIYLIYNENNPEMYCIPARMWRQPNEIFVLRKYDGPDQKSKPEYGINSIKETIKNYKIDDIIFETDQNRT